MARRRDNPGRVGGGSSPRPSSDKSTVHTGRVTETHDLGPPEIPPLYRRRPWMFAFLMIACIAMVMSMAAGLFTAI